MIIEQFAVGMLQTNCYLVGDEESRQAVVIDPGGDGMVVVNRLNQLKLNLVAILATHAHFDHVMDAWTVKEEAGGEIYLHAKDLPLLHDRMVGLGAVDSTHVERKIDKTYSEPDVLVFGSLHINVLETPGHSPGHVSLYLPANKVIFVGDTLFQGSIGRTDFAGGSMDQLLASVRNKIFPLPGEVVVYTGHGPRTTVDRERRGNPFFQ